MAKRKKKTTPQEEAREEEVIVSDTSDETQDESVEEVQTESTENEPQDEEIVSEPEIQTVSLVYLGTSEKATVKGKVSGQKYEFYKDEYKMPVPVEVDERDSSGILALQGKACCGKNPNQLFMTKNDWDLEINTAKKFNR